ncbi:unnamed protein product [Owenia fusiformis]|uniref:Uncharacterized protein n=1 Tax=Owenia fusiformis TaxID=6347 RepID=A0A8J1Y0D6_OWEFU|nr:unnamed protein product [Owenia fusiformis]
MASKNNMDKVVGQTNKLMAADKQGNQKSRRKSQLPPGTTSGVPASKNVAPSTRSSVSEVPTHRQMVTLENSYKMKPAPEETFSSCKVEKMMADVLETHLKKTEYNKDTCTKLTQELTSIIKTRVKEMGYNRYKLVCSITIGEVGGQSASMASRCVWDDTVDNSACSSFKNDSLYAVALVFAMFCE